MIPFRKQRMATSVVNRIMNVYAGVSEQAGSGVPAAPVPLGEGAALDMELEQPKPPVDADPQTASAIALAPLAK